MKGRGNSSSITVGEATKLDLSYLLKNNFIQKGCEVTFQLGWSNGSQIKALTHYTEKDIYIRLIYQVTYKDTKEVKGYDYKIYIQRLKSNLGIGEVLYFICPETSLYCRKLFMCYGYGRFKHRLAYKNKIYYHSQTISKESRNTTRYFKLDETISKICKQRQSKTYKGKETSKRKRLIKLIEKRTKADKIRQMELSKWLSNYYGVNL